MQLANQSQDLIKLTSELVAFKSVTPNDAGSLSYIENYLNKLGFTFIRLDKNNTSNLIATYGDINSQNPIFAFAGHVDVVPTGDITKWTHPPFTLIEDNEKLYGRGIGDMKGAIASFLIAVTNFIHSHTNHKLTIMLLLTSDEETSGVDGTPIMVEYLKNNDITLDYCLVGEPTSVNTIGDVVKVGRRGSLNCHLEIIGNQGHVAYPELCINPIHEFSGALNEIVNTKWDKGNEYFPPTSLQVTNINAGLGVDNVIPYNLYVKFNIRYNNLQTNRELQNKIVAILDKYKIKYNVTWNNSALPFLSKQDKLCRVVVNTIAKITSIQPQLLTDGGTSDARFLVNVSHEILELGLSNKYIHQINECIHKDELIKLTEIYYNILTLLTQ